MNTLQTPQEWIQAGVAAHAKATQHLADIRRSYPHYQLCFTILDPTVYPEPLTLICGDDIRVAVPANDINTQYSHWHKVITDYNFDDPKQRRLKPGVFGLFCFLVTNAHILLDLECHLGREVTLVIDWHDKTGNHLLEHNQFFAWLYQIGRAGYDQIPYGSAGPSITFAVTEDVLKNFSLFAGGTGRQRQRLMDFFEHSRKCGWRY